MPEFLKFRIKDVDRYPATMFQTNVINKLDAPKWWTIMADKMSKMEIKKQKKKPKRGTEHEHEEGDDEEENDDEIEKEQAVAF